MRRYNVIEYKSPTDNLSIDDFYKTLGYACLFKGYGTNVNQIPTNELYKRLDGNSEYGLKIEHRDIGKDALRGK